MPWVCHTASSKRANQSHHGRSKNSKIPTARRQATMAQASGRGFPVRSLVYGRLVDGKPTDFVWNLYQDHLLLIVTQLGSIGTVIAAT